MPHIIIVPGFQGSDENHWQTWLQQQLPDCQRLQGVDWQQPVLATWTKALLQQIDALSGTVYLVAHSFGCLVSTVAIADRPDRVAGALLVAPASPERFSPLGRRSVDPSMASITSLLPTFSFNITGYVVASENDPWMPLPIAKNWADTWGMPFINIGEAGHINAQSGYHTWHLGYDLIQCMLHKQYDINKQQRHRPSKGRGSNLAKVRYETRRLLDI